MKKKDLIPLLITVSSLSIFHLYQKNIVSKQHQDHKKIPLPKQNIVTSHTVKKGPASLDVPQEQDRSPSQESKWVKKLKEKLYDPEFFNSMQIKSVSHTKSLIDGEYRPTEVVLVTMEDKKGNPSSFRALIDPARGTILTTWGRPIFEGRTPTQYSIEGAEGQGLSRPLKN